MFISLPHLQQFLVLWFHRIQHLITGYFHDVKPRNAEVHQKPVALLSEIKGKLIFRSLFTKDSVEVKRIFLNIRNTCEWHKIQIVQSHEK